jgi:MYXO-CTERM domain-containing protein
MAAQAYSATISLLVSSSGGGPNQTVTFTVSGTGVDMSTSDGGNDASTGITDAAADAAESSTAPADASVDVAEASTVVPEASMGAPDTSTDAPATASDASTSGMDAATSGPDASPEAGDDADFHVDAEAPDAASSLPPSSSSCSCRAAGTRSEDALIPLGGFVVLLALRRRKRTA